MSTPSVSTSPAGMREKLASVAFELFAEHGFRSVNLDQISIRAGVTKGSLYWHYKSKKEVILAACGLYYRNWHSRTAEVVAKADGATDALRSALTFSVESCLFDRRNRVFTTEVFALSLQDKDVCASWTDFYKSVHETFVNLVKDANGADGIGAKQPSETVDLMLSTIEGIKLRAVFEPEICKKDGVKGFVESLLRILSSA